MGRRVTMMHRLLLTRARLAFPPQIAASQSPSPPQNSTFTTGEGGAPIVVSFDAGPDSNFYFILRGAENAFILGKKMISDVDSRHAIDSSKGLGNSGVKSICLCLTLDTLLAVILFVIAVNFFKAKGGLKGKSKRRHGKVQGSWRRRGEKRSRMRHPKVGSPFKGIAKFRGFKLAFFLFLLIAGVSGVYVVDMNGLFNTVSNENNWADNTGNSIMANGDTTTLAVGPYKCSEGTCADSSIMLWTDDLYGEVKCVEDNASCVLDGENARRGMAVGGTGSGTFILRALTFDKGYTGGGGGIWIEGGAIVDLELCVFSNNRATASYAGGGAIDVQSSGTSVNAYGTSFYGNTADSGNGNDIYTDTVFGSPTITIHNTCPSPYSSNIPSQGKTRMRIV
jgi:hypothetical protein